MDSIFLGSRVARFLPGLETAPYSRVDLLDEDGKLLATAGDDSGRTLEARHPDATQAMADSILASVRGYVYRPYEADNALLDPAAELGDGVTIDGVYSVLAGIDREFDLACAADVSAPDVDEIDDEYPYISPTERKIQRNMQTTRSLIAKTSEQILLKVENDLSGLSSSIQVDLDQIRLDVENGLDGLSSSFSVELGKIASRVEGAEGDISALEQTDKTLSTRITNTQGDLSSLEQLVDSFTLTVSNGSTTSTIKLMAGTAEIASQTISMKGLVTITGLSGGTTTIDGACIKTGLISADRLELTGAITWRDLSGSVQDDINDAYAMAEDAQNLAAGVDDTVSGWTYRGSTYIDGAMIKTGTVMASYLLGGEVGLLDDSEYQVGGIIITDTNTGDGLEFYTDSGGIRINAAGDFWVDARHGSLGVTRSGVVCDGDCVPQSGGRYSLGAGGLNWSDVYADNDVIVTSDLTQKHGVTYGLEAYDAFYSALRPMSFQFNNGTSGRRHIGLGAQDVERALLEAGLTSMDFAGLIKSPRTDQYGQIYEGEYNYALRYGELTAMNIWKIQRLDARVAELERRLSQ